MMILCISGCALIGRFGACIAIIFFDIVIARIAVAAVDLNGYGADTIRSFRHKEFGLRGINADLLLVCILHRSGTKYQQSCCFDLSRPCREFHLNCLVFGDWLLE